MLTPLLEKLLILQDRDGKRLGLEAQLKAAPIEVTMVEQKIAAEKTAIETARAELKQLESSKKLLETEIGSTETKLAKYKTQQSLVKKNDEYQALGHEIETTEAAIGTLEEQELQIMYQIDEAKKKFAAAEAVLKQNIAGHEARIRSLRERETNLSAELKEAQAEVATAREPVGEPTLRVYDRLATRHMPVCVPVRGNTCGGCHLKVSSEVESALRGKADPAKLVTCDQCGRIVWRDA
ncbi:MAG TPA: C4-type zinc ribbon domain-containing protein [Rariglobus sp.]|jgi:predicted  nucleic acid-binding Zn-ribbon protein|nr:C4-type zinc ribbon domain-containing protein [Rariglobus sp.]